VVKGLRAEGNAHFVYGAVGFLTLAAIIVGVMLGFAHNPQWVTARFVWALVVTYLLMCALFESFVYPFVVMFSVPLALVGGFAGLSIVHNQTDANPLIGTQNLDVLTMLGFIILVGVVVNNAILIVHQSLNYLRGFEKDDDGNPVKLALHDAVTESLRTRIRPVFMSTMTSVGGMLPLVLFPGAGSELYRGLGSVVVGGLLVSTVFTLLLVPLTLSLTLEMTSAMGALFGRKEGEDRRAEALAL
jgi:HAE1 family hydrophobic/amphiphilic exporter-1